MYPFLKRICFVLVVVLASGCRKHEIPHSVPAGFSVHINGMQWAPANIAARSYHYSACASCPYGAAFALQTVDSNDSLVYIALDSWNERAGNFGNYPNGQKHNLYMRFNSCYSCGSANTEYLIATDRYSKLAITALSDTNIQGIFNGTLVNHNGDSMLMSGEFNLPFNQ